MKLKSTRHPLLSSLNPDGGNSAICWNSEEVRVVRALPWSGFTREQLKVEVFLVPWV